MTLYSLAYFTPPIVQTFGYTPVQTQLLTTPPFVCAFLLTLITAWFSDRYAQRGLCAIAMSVLALIGYIMLYKSLLTSVRYVALFLAISGVYSVSCLSNFALLVLELTRFDMSRLLRHCVLGVCLAFSFLAFSFLAFSFLAFPFSYRL